MSIWWWLEHDASIYWECHHPNWLSYFTRYFVEGDLNPFFLGGSIIFWALLRYPVVAIRDLKMEAAAHVTHLPYLGPFIIQWFDMHHELTPASEPIWQFPISETAASYPSALDFRIGGGIISKAIRPWSCTWKIVDLKQMSTGFSIATGHVRFQVTLSRRLELQYDPCDLAPFEFPFTVLKWTIFPIEVIEDKHIETLTGGFTMIFIPRRAASKQ